MSEIGTFYGPDEMDYEAITETYRAAFREAPWREVSKCADAQEPQRCAGGMSSLVIGDICRTCDAMPTRPAYEDGELIGRFTELGKTRPARWYVETVQDQVALAAVCWPVTAAELAAEKYGDVPAMRPWLTAALGEQQFVYLDEIFRDRTVRPVGNLANFKPMLEAFGALYGLKRVMYRSKQERLLAKTQTTFGNAATIVSPEEGLPDWRGRSVAIIALGEAA